MPNTATGSLGERETARYLEAHGYEIVARNFRTRFGEIDLVAKDSRYLVFVEVKTRDTGAIGHPFEFITAAKQRKVILAAKAYLMKFPSALQPRFDAAAVFTENGAVLRVEYLENAFC